MYKDSAGWSVYDEFGLFGQEKRSKKRTLDDYNLQFELEQTYCSKIASEG
jgi:hypothetical protein